MSSDENVCWYYVTCLSFSTLQKCKLKIAHVTFIFMFEIMYLINICQNINDNQKYLSHYQIDAIRSPKNLQFIYYILDYRVQIYEITISKDDK